MKAKRTGSMSVWVSNVIATGLGIRYYKSASILPCSDCPGEACIRQELLVPKVSKRALALKTEVQSRPFRGLTVCLESGVLDEVTFQGFRWTNGSRSGVE